MLGLDFAGVWAAAVAACYEIKGVTVPLPPYQHCPHTSAPGASCGCVDLASGAHVTHRVLLHRAGVLLCVSSQLCC